MLYISKLDSTRRPFACQSTLFGATIHLIVSFAATQRAKYIMDTNIIPTKSKLIETSSHIHVLVSYRADLPSADVGSRWLQPASGS